eukprot:CAMPEP_0183713532 /NCGR_PEP_ID=MMETSP0737-20130205/8350_1 /TAXON_ID=385413 /ORGANISM="Thalassiosira miniscula, Strain CCMP1093" /LENGTH=1064 /DNA_ID=CAMNT_0025942323 /DNA_START=60 /DNA_END=3254 /DNA_ORIENTATION=+
MDPPDAPDDDLSVDRGGFEEQEDGVLVSGAGAVEMQPLVSSSRGIDAPMDPDGDDIVSPPPPPPRPRSSEPPSSATANVAYAKNTESEPMEQVASMLSNEGILNGLERLKIVIGTLFAPAVTAVAERVAPPADSASSAPSQASDSVDDGVDHEVESTKRKKMMLLLMATLFVALMGAILAKGTAAGIEIGIKGGEQEEAHHKHVVSGASGKSGFIIHHINVSGYQPQTMVNASDYIVPGTEDAPPLSAAKGRPYYPILNHFQVRNPDIHYAKTWGYFDFEDPDPKWDGKMRPQPDFTSVPNRDVNNSAFPEDAWQRSPEYMKPFLAEAKKLVNRTIEAVYAEYGVGLAPDGSITLDEKDWLNREKFAPFALRENTADPAGRGGSTSTKASFDGIARRFIHHVMTGDTFKLTLGGHSAAAGHGAGFNQSYIIEAGHVLEPVFAHLGVEMRAYNFAQGGMGTFQQALAGMDLRGKETDWIMWDSRMTERMPEMSNFFFRQALIAGNRAPVLMADSLDPTLHAYHDGAGASIAHQGNGWTPSTVSEEQVAEVPWAAKYLYCARGSTANCPGHQYDAGCWVEREDFKPKNPQGAIVGGQASWHPGNRVHKRRGRMIALIVLRALDYALDKWEELAAESGYPIAEEHWHVTEYYSTIREKAKTVGGCFMNNFRIGQKRRLEDMTEEEAKEEESLRRRLDDTDFWPMRICNVPLQGRSNWGPRHNPMETSLLSIMKPNKYGDKDPAMATPASLQYTQGACYEPPDLPAPWTQAPPEEAFAPLIGAARHLHVNTTQHQHRQLRSRGDLSPTPEKARELLSTDEEGRIDPVFASNYINTTRVLDEGDDKIEPGLGVNNGWGRPGVCDGSSHHWCDKHCDNSCFMGGTQDNRGMVCIGGFSGWVVFELKNVNHGFIGARIEAWRKLDNVPIQKGWTSVNNGDTGNYHKEGDERRLHEEHMKQKNREFIEQMEREIQEDIDFVEGNGVDPTSRRLGGGQVCGIAGDYTFTWALNGEIKGRWNMAEFCQHYTRLNYNLDVIKFLDEEGTSGDFELAMKIEGGIGKTMCITHLYWA